MKGGDEMINKKTQGEIITTVLIILLVLAAIVIVWQVVNSTLKKGSAQVESQSGCIGVSLEVINTSTGGGNNNFVVKRNAGGGKYNQAIPAIIVDGTRSTVSPTCVSFTEAMGTCSFTLPIATKTVEVAYVADGVTCPITGEWP